MSTLRDIEDTGNAFGFVSNHIRLGDYPHRMVSKLVHVLQNHSSKPKCVGFLVPRHGELSDGKLSDGTYTDASACMIPWNTCCVWKAPVSWHSVSDDHTIVGIEEALPLMDEHCVLVRSKSVTSTRPNNPHADRFQRQEGSVST